MRRSRPVVVPCSPPFLRRSAASCPSSSVGNGPAPTRVEYALTTSRSRRGPGPAPEPTGRGPGDGVRRGDEGVGPVVDVEQRRLRALFEEHAAAGVEGVPGRERGGVADAALELVPVRQERVRHLLQVELGLALHGRSDRALPIAATIFFFRSSRRGPGRGCPAAAPCRRSRGRCRASSSRSGSCPAASRRPRRGTLVRHDHVRVLNPQARRSRRPGSPRELAQQHLGVDDHAVADHAGRAGVEDPRRHEVERVLHVPVHDGVPGVVAALEADDDVGALGQQVDELALPSSPHWAPTITMPGMTRRG